MNYSFLSKYSGWEIIMTVIVSVMLFLIGITESSYINLSIRNFFIFSFFSLAVLALAGLSGLSRKMPYRLSMPSFAMLVWLGYIVIHAMLTGKTEQYFLLFYSLSFLLLLSSERIFSIGKIDFKHIYKLFFILALVEAIVCIMQYIGIVSTHNSYFTVKGTFDNPNTTAMYMVVCIPYLASELLMKRNRVILLISLFFILAALIMINCRTAYLGLFSIIIVYLFRWFDYKNYLSGKGITKTVVFFSLIVVILISTFFYLYESKKASADGRVFIWKVSTQMVAQKPFSGYGYGFFPREYNLYQASYFRTHITTIDEKSHASYVYMPYNDLLEQAIQGGVAGAALYLICMGLIVYYSLKNKLIPESALIISFLIMSQVNYGIQAIPLWILFLLSAASVVSQADKQLINRLHPRANQFIALGILAMVAGIGYDLSDKREAQQQLPIAIDYFKNYRYKQAIHLLDTYKNRAGTSELYYGTYAKILMETNRYEKATEAFNTALMYAAEPSYLMDKALCCKRTGQVNTTVQCLQLVASMKPFNLRSRFLLMNLYANTNSGDSATLVAHEIIKMPVKVQSAESKYYIAQAAAYLKKN